MKRVVITALILLGILHQDYWWWNSIEPLVFGFIPIGLAFHIGVSLAAGLLWALAVHYCWPRDVDDVVSFECPNCNQANRESARFCASCGCSLPVSVPERA